MLWDWMYYFLGINTQTISKYSSNLKRWMEPTNKSKKSNYKLSKFMKCKISFFKDWNKFQEFKGQVTAMGRMREMILLVNIVFRLCCSDNTPWAFPESVNGVSKTNLRMLFSCSNEVTRFTYSSSSKYGCTNVTCSKQLYIRILGNS